jgi:hypothetical protein
MNNQVEVKKLTLGIGDQILEVSLEEARKLRAALNDLFGPPPVVAQGSAPWWPHYSPTTIGTSPHPAGTTIWYCGDGMANGTQN